MKESHHKAAEYHNLAVHADCSATTQHENKDRGDSAGVRVLTRVTLSIGLLFAFSAVAFGQHGNWFKPMAAPPRPTFRQYSTTDAPASSGKPNPKSSFVSSTTRVFPHLATG